MVYGRRVGKLDVDKERMGVRRPNVQVLAHLVDKQMCAFSLHTQMMLILRKVILQIKSGKRRISGGEKQMLNHLKFAIYGKRC